MALAQRPASRFFVAFYRWSRCTQRPTPCTFSPRYPQNTPQQLATLASIRSYHATRRLHEQSQSSHGALQDDEGTLDDIEADRHAVVDPTQLKDNVRRLMRKVPASVAVITVASHDPKTNQQLPLGIAVSSLSTVTLDPPTISFNIKQPSKALDAIQAAQGRFRVHFLNGTGQGVNIVENFCNGNHPDAYEKRRTHLSMHFPQSSVIQPEDIEAEVEAGARAPQVRGLGVRAAAECILTQMLPVADHIILVAQVKSLGSKDSPLPTLAYVDGTYRRLGENIISHHKEQQDASQPAAQPKPVQESIAQQKPAQEPAAPRPTEATVAFDYPLFPGEKERHLYVKRMKAFLKGVDRKQLTRDIIRGLRTEVKFVANLLGVNLEAIIQLCQFGAAKKEMTILPEFSGRLTPEKLAKLTERAKLLVKADRRFLDARYSDFLRYLDVLVSGTDLLPSDVLNPLRAEGLVPPFQPADLSTRLGVNEQNIFFMEQIEHRLREHLSTLTDKEMLGSPFHYLFSVIDVPFSLIPYFRESRTRLNVEMTKRFYRDWKMDISGHVTPEEARVVVRRIVEHLGVDRMDVWRANGAQDTGVLLRNIGVHPLVTGVNADFVLCKIRHAYSTTPDFSDFRTNVEEMLQPYFAKSVTWEELQWRIKQFVQEMPIRATTWKHRDKLAAMGLTGQTIIDTPITSKRQTLDQSRLMDTLLAKELKKHYGNGTDEENEAIADFLLNRYDFDVISKTAAASTSTEDVMTRSSADDLVAAMSQHEEVFVPHGNPLRKQGTDK